MGFREALAIGLFVLLGFVVIIGAISGDLNYNAALTVLGPLLGVVLGFIFKPSKDKDDEKP